MLKSNKKNMITTACFYGSFVNGVIAVIIGAVIPLILKDFNMGYNTGGILLSLYSVGSVLASIAGGSIALIAMIVVGFFLAIVFKSPALLMLGFFLIGIGKGSNVNMGNTNINKLSDGDSGLLNILHTFAALGSFIAPLLASFLLTLGFGWRPILTLVAALAILMVILFKASGIESISFKRGKKSTKYNFDFIKERSFYLSAGMMSCYTGVEYAVNGWLVTYLRDSGRMDTSMAQRMLSIMWVVIIVGRLFNVYIAKKFDNKNIVLFSSFGSLICFLLFMASSNLWITILWILGLGFCLSGIYASGLTNAGNIIKESKLAMSTILGIAGLGGMIMPFIIGLVAEKVGITGGMITIAFSAGMLFTLALINKLWKVKA